MRSRGRVGCLALAVVAAALVGCTGDAGFGLPSLAVDAADAVIAESGAVSRTLSGSLVVEPNGCFAFDSADADDPPRAWIVWPDTARQDDDVVELKSGARVGQGTRLEATGAYVALSDLPDDDESSSFGSFGRFCGADARGVVVLTGVKG